MRRLDAVSRKAERDRNYTAFVGAERLRAQALGLLAPQELTVKSTVAVTTSGREPMTPEEVGEELVVLMEVVTAFVMKGTVELTPAFATNVAKLNAAVHGGRAVASPSWAFARSSARHFE